MATLTPDEIKYIVSRTPTPSAPAQISVPESYARGAIDSLSFGMAPAITGAVESVLSDKTYTQARDESLRAYEAAKAANPTAYFAGGVTGTVAGSLAGGLALRGAVTAAKATQLARAALAAEKVAGIGKGAVGGAIGGAASGAAQAAGSYYKPGEVASVGELASQAAVGGTVGGLAGAVLTPIAKTFVGGAAKKEEQAAVKYLASGRDAKAVRELALRGKLTPVIDEVPGLRGSLRKGQGAEAFEIANDRLTEVNAAADALYARVPGPGVPVQKLRDIVEDAAKALEKESSVGVKAAKELRNDLASQEELWSGQTNVSLQQIRAEKQAMWRARKNTPNVDENKLVDKAKRDIATKYGDEIASYIERNAKDITDPSVSVEALRNLNKRIHVLSYVVDALHDRANKETAGEASKGMIRGAISSTSQAATRALAMLVREASTNGVSGKFASLAQDALEKGVPETVIRGVSSVAAKKYGSPSPKAQTTSYEPTPDELDLMMRMPVLQR